MDTDDTRYSDKTGQTDKTSDSGASNQDGAAAKPKPIPAQVKLETSNQPELPESAAATSAPQASPATKPSSSQVTTGLIILIVVLLFIMLMLSINSKRNMSGGTSEGFAVLEAQNAQLRADANAERARRGLPPIPAGATEAKTTALRLQQDANSIASLVDQWQTELETKNATIDELQKQLVSRDDHSKHLYNQIATLQNQLDQSANAANQMISLSNDLKMANNQIEIYRKQLAEFQGRPTNEQFTDLRKQLNESLAMTGKLELQVDGLQQQTKNSIDQTLYDETVAELDKLRPELNRQRYEIQRLRALLDRARLFIESEKDLPADAARLFAKLRELDSVRGPALADAYKNIEQTLGARVIHRQSFATGSSQITFDRETMIKNAMGKGAAVDSFFLVVGYASKTGDATSNRKLSAARATTAASVVNLLKTEQQQVKAVYLGQTNRFSQDNPIENQICEVWEIKK